MRIRYNLKSSTCYEYLKASNIFILHKDPQSSDYEQEIRSSESIGEADVSASALISQEINGKWLNVDSRWFRLDVQRDYVNNNDCFDVQVQFRCPRILR